ncbi:MAG TPA: VapC toxin family PIN domain ribonuclease [Polyangiaceae bacterium]|nr:VapC toxin family PIN domain ribonuclease [Polyangiaceae bacterium]
MILLDTSGLLSALDSSQKQHQQCRQALIKARPPFLLSPFVLAEIDYLLATRVGVNEELAFLEEVANGAYQLEPFAAADVSQARAIVDQYRNLEIGVADASLVVLSTRHNLVDVLTLDERHFRALRAAGGKRFRIIPTDQKR